MAQVTDIKEKTLGRRISFGGRIYYLGLEAVRGAKLISSPL